MNEAIGRTVAGLAVIAALVSLGASGVDAQDRDPDFLFGTPGYNLDFFLGVSSPSASSELFDFTFDELTLERSDLRAVAFGASLSRRVNERLDVGVEFSYSGASTEAEYRDWEGADGLPIVQTTRFTRFPLSVMARIYLNDRGRSVGRLAWVPNQWVPYVGGGVGATWYEFNREGEFLDTAACEDFGDCAIVYDDLSTDGAAFTGHALAGVEYSVRPRFAVTAEGRYSWASGGERNRDFIGFDALDLSGFQATVGFRIRFGGDSF